MLKHASGPAPGAGLGCGEGAGSLQERVDETGFSEDGLKIDDLDALLLGQFGERGEGGGLPDPRGPTKMVSRARTRPRAAVSLSISCQSRSKSSRPASTGGAWPAPGV